MPPEKHRCVSELDYPLIGGRPRSVKNPGTGIECILRLHAPLAGACANAPNRAGLALSPSPESASTAPR